MQSEFAKLHVGYPPEGKIDRVGKVLGKFHTSFAHVIYHFQYVVGTYNCIALSVVSYTLNLFRTAIFRRKKIFREQRTTRKCCVQNFITF